MESTALVELQRGISEVVALRKFPPKMKSSRSADSVLRNQATVAHRRACTVLLCSHYERYIYAVNELVTDHLNACALSSEMIPTRIKLLQSRSIVDQLSLQQWDNREGKLSEFSSTHSPLWVPGAQVTSLDPSPNLESMKSPKVADVRIYFRLFGIQDVFDSITRSHATKGRLIRGITSLVDSRNGIAHGDQTVQPQRAEITEYAAAVTTFATRADKLLATQLAKLTSSAPPW